MHLPMACFMQRFDRISQEPDSNDCGFFSGYMVALHKHHKGDLKNMIASRQLVYMERERYQRTPNPLGKGKAWLQPSAMITYLKQLGLTGYSLTEGPRDPAKFVKAVNDRLDRKGNWGVPIASFGGNGGHWIAIIQKRPGNSTSGPMWVAYDPAGNVQGVPGNTVGLLPAMAIAGTFLRSLNLQLFFAG